MWRGVLLSGVSVLAMIDGAQAVESFVGRWASNPAICAGAGENIASAPMIVTEHSLQRSAVTCRFGKIYKAGRAVYIQAHCLSDGRSSTIPITLETRGARLAVSWNRGRPEEMQRCP